MGIILKLFSEAYLEATCLVRKGHNSGCKKYTPVINHGKSKIPEQSGGLHGKKISTTFYNYLGAIAMWITGENGGEAVKP